MGLDVYLYRYEDYEATRAIEKAADERSDRIWDEVASGVPYKQMTEAQLGRWRALVKEANDRDGLGEYGEDITRKQCIEQQSALHPDHLFKVGYFRSSYNDAGVNAILRNLIGVTLYDLFPEFANDQHEGRPDWPAARQRTVDALARFRERVGEAPYAVMKLASKADRYPNLPAITTAAEAIELVVQERKRSAEQPGDFRDYSSAAGSFFLGKDAPRFRAFVNGFDVWPSGRREPIIWGVYEGSEFEWYAQALEIVIETCDYVLSQPDREKYVMSWSG